jgi:hypothetical protein
MVQHSRATALILVTAALTVTGCTDGGGSSGDVSVAQEQGVAVTAFEPDPQNVLSGQTFFLRMELENKGASQARNVQAKILDPVFGPGPRSPSLESESQSVGLGNDSRLFMDFGDLRAPDPETGTDPLPRTKTANIKAPTGIQTGIEFPIDLVARIYYEYTTTANTQITLMSSQRFRSEQPERQSVSVDNSGGPVQLSINEQTPVRVNSGSTRSICVVVENKGSGRTIAPSAYDGASSPSTNRDNLGRVQLTLETGSGIQLTDGETATVRLVGDTKKGQHCFSARPNYVSSSGGQQTVLLTAEADYAYYTSTESSFTVEGRETTSSTTPTNTESGQQYEYIGDSDQRGSYISRAQVSSGANDNELCRGLKQKDVDPGLFTEVCDLQQ